MNRLLKRNKQEFWYRNYIGIEPIYDEYQNETSEHKVIYGNPVQMFANISGEKGEAEIAIFGQDLQYDKSIALSSVPFSESCVLYIDRMPIVEDDGSTLTPYDYEVTRIAKTLNYVFVATSRVNVSAINSRVEEPDDPDDEEPDDEG